MCVIIKPGCRADEPDEAVGFGRSVCRVWSRCARTPARRRAEPLVGQPISHPPRVGPVYARSVIIAVASLYVRPVAAVTRGRLEPLFDALGALYPHARNPVHEAPVYA